MDNLGNEWALLEKISVLARDSAEQVTAALTAAQGQLNIDRLVSQAIRHNMVPLLYQFMSEYDLLDLAEFSVQRHLAASARLRLHETALLVEETERVVTRLQDAEIAVACTKGIIYQSQLYDSLGTRQLGDVDLMIRPEARDQVQEILLDLGYSAAKIYDARSGQLVDLPRDERFVYRMYPDHLPHFYRLTGDTVVPYFCIDVAFSLTWFGSGWQIPPDDVFAEIEQVVIPARHGEVTLPSLAPAYSFLFLLLHLFREAWFQRKFAASDVRLTPFADIVRFWARIGHNHVPEIIQAIRQFSLQPPVAWVTHHVDVVFSTDLTSTLELEQYTEESWVRSAGGTDGSFLQWHGSMRNRLSSTSLPDLTPAPAPPFGNLAKSTGRRP